MSHQPDIDKNILKLKILWSKYKLLINTRESTGLKHFNDPEVFIVYSNDMNDTKILKNIIQIKNAKYWQ